MRTLSTILFILALLGILSAFSLEGPVFEPRQVLLAQLDNLEYKCQMLDLLVQGIPKPVIADNHLNDLVSESASLRELTAAIRDYQGRDPLHAPWELAISMTLLLSAVIIRRRPRATNG